MVKGDAMSFVADKLPQLLSGEAEIKADGAAARKLALDCRWRVSTRLLRRTVAYRGCADLWRIVIVAGWRRNLGQYSAGGSRCFNGEKEVKVHMERSTVVLRSAWLDLLEKEEAAGGKDLPPQLTVQKSLLVL
ncbi:hypothetical protein Peur_023956 [Populus x canadensis]